MAVIINLYDRSTQIVPFLVQIEKDTANSHIIIIDIATDYSTSIRANVDNDVVWIKVETGHSLTVLGSTPGNVTKIGTHLLLNKTLAKIKAGEAFITEHSATPPSDGNQNAVTGYQFGTYDVVYLRIDRLNDHIEVYK